MKISATSGSRKESLRETCSKLDLRAEIKDEQKFLSRLYNILLNFDLNYLKIKLGLMKGISKVDGEKLHIYDLLYYNHKTNEWYEFQDISKDDLIKNYELYVVIRREFKKNLKPEIELIHISRIKLE